jgi:hypothetical protein
MLNATGGRAGYGDEKRRLVCNAMTSRKDKCLVQKHDDDAILYRSEKLLSASN